MDAGEPAALGGAAPGGGLTSVPTEAAGVVAGDGAGATIEGAGAGAADAAGAADDGTAAGVGGGT